jgi:[NiFe] hydrogenase diaphorase moiety large subunit
LFMHNKLKKILNGNGVDKDIEELIDWGKSMKTNRCGLGHTAANPILSSIKNFRKLYDDLIKKDTDFRTEFDLASAVAEAAEYTNRKADV